MKFFTLQFSKVVLTITLLTLGFAQSNFIQAQTGGTIEADQTVCFGETPDVLESLTLPAIPAQYSVDDLEFLWMYSVPGQQGWTVIPGSDSPDYQPSGLGQNTLFIRCIRRPWQDQVGSYPIESNLVTINVLPSPSFSSPNFGGGNIVIQEGGTVPFSVTTSGSVFWDFGNGSTSTSATPNITYNTPGTYTVSLTISGGPCPITLTTTVYVLAILPVELTNFAASQVKNQIDLQWETASEENNSYFVIEKSNDGRAFEKLEKIEGQGTTSQTNRYSFEDLKPTAGDNYYRLKQMDFNGEFTYSEIILVEFKSTTTVFNVYPNPVKDRATLTTSNIDGDHSVNIFTIQGVKVSSTLLNGTEATVNMDGFAQGIYFVQVLNAQNEIVFRSKILKK